MKEGDVVGHRGIAGLLMTVSFSQPGEAVCVCEWFDRAELYRAEFVMSDLFLAEGEEARRYASYASDLERMARASEYRDRLERDMKAMPHPGHQAGLRETASDVVRAAVERRATRQRERDELAKSCPFPDVGHMAKALYGAYGDSAGWKNFRGEAMPAWEDLPETIRGHWRVVAGRAMDVLR